MEYYSVKDLYAEMEDKLSDLGVTPNFKENPAYNRIVNDIKSLISEMNILNMENILVDKSENEIVFKSVETNNQFEMHIGCINPETIRCMRVEENFLYHEKYFVDEIIKLNPSYGIERQNGFVSINNANCRSDESNVNTRVSERIEYGPSGVMKQRESRTYAPYKLELGYHSIDAKADLANPMQDFNGIGSANYIKRELLVRQKLDTVNFVLEDKINNVYQTGVLPLNRYNSLSDIPANMTAVRGNIEIPPLSQEEIEMMIQRETNPKIMEGLRACADGRDTYSYYSVGPYDMQEEEMAQGKAR